MEIFKFRLKYGISIRSNWNLALRIWCLCAILLLHSGLYAQESDFELWKAIEVKKGWGKDVTFSFEEQVRLNNNVSQFKSAFFDLGARYELGKRARISLGYRYTNRLKSEGQRLYTDFSFKSRREFLNIEPAFRIRYQEDYEVGESAERSVRPKISIKTDIKPLRLSVSFAAELFYQLLTEGNQFDRYRFNFGLSYPLSNQSSVTLAYLFQEEFDVRNPLTSSIVSLSFSIELYQYDLESRRRMPRVKR